MLPLAALRAAGGRPVVGMFHATARSNLGYALCRRALAREFARITVPAAVSQPARHFVAQYFPGAYRLVPNGVDLERFSPAVPPAPGPAAAGGRSSWPWPPRSRKGLEHLIEALPRVARALGPVDLVIAGDGPRAGSLCRRAARLAPGLVRLLGPVRASQVPGLYAAADCLAAPAVRNESFGIVLLEAMASGRPVVATDISGYRLVVAPGETGLLVPPGDAAALGDALVAVLGDRARGRALGEAGRARARAFSWERVTARLLDVYAEALGERPNAGDGLDLELEVGAEPELEAVPEAI
jgi:phosphatidylinositol alpha-mannosyltransferase